MAHIVYRIQTDSNRNSILDGVGAQLRGGRWNVRGRPLVYTSTTPELCFLDYMVHLDGTPLTDLPPLILCTISIPDNAVQSLDVTQLPAGWNNPHITPTALARFMDQQFRHFQTLCIAIPSAVVPLSPSRHVLIDPLHSLRSQCSVLSIDPYFIDPRRPANS